MKKAEDVKQCRLSGSIGANNHQKWWDISQMNVTEDLVILQTNGLDLHRDAFLGCRRRLGCRRCRSFGRAFPRGAVAASCHVTATIPDGGAIAGSLRSSPTDGPVRPLLARVGQDRGSSRVAA